MRKKRQYVFESLEPRLSLSAIVGTAIVQAAVVTNPDDVPPPDPEPDPGPFPGPPR